MPLHINNMIKNPLFLILIFPVILSCTAYIHGDCNADGLLNISDATFFMHMMFGKGEVPECLEACDMNGDGHLSISDPVYLLLYLFLGGPAPP